jgi:hypothetical protein
VESAAGAGVEIGATNSAVTSLPSKQDTEVAVEPPLLADDLITSKSPPWSDCNPVLNSGGGEQQSKDKAMRGWHQKEQR